MLKDLVYYDQKTDSIYIEKDYLINLLRTLQYERYPYTETEKEYVCIEGVIDSITNMVNCYFEGGPDE